jgi:putative peptidoglycan lipid II flippase
MLHRTINKIISSQFIKNTISTTILSTVARGIGFLIPFFIAAWFGISSETDTFFFSYGIILYFAQIFAPTVETVIVPYIADHRRGNEDIGLFLGKILGSIVLWVSVLSLAIMLFGLLVIRFVTRFNQTEFSQITLLLIETLPLITLLTITSALSGTLNAYNKFAIPALSPALRAVFTVSFIYFTKDILGIHAIAIGYVIGEIFRAAFLLVMLRKFRLFSLIFSFAITREILQFFKTASFQIGGMIAVGFNPIINKSMASWLNKGDISILEYGDRLYVIPVSFLCSGLMVTLLSHWSNNYNRENKEKTKSQMNKTLVYVAIVSLFISLCCLLINGPLINRIYGFNNSIVIYLPMIKTVFAYLVIGITPYILTQVFVSFIVAIKDTRILLRCSIWKTVLNIILNFFFMKMWGIKGIAISTTCLSLYTFFYLGIYVRKRLAAISR